MTPLPVLDRSPLDELPPSRDLVQISASISYEWVPSRFNARVITPKGGMILWNSYTGALTAFGPEHRIELETALSRKGIRGQISGLAKYLYNRGYLVPSSANESMRAEVLIGQQHFRNDRLELILLASEDCNFRCTYCYEDFSRGTMLPAVREAIKQLLTKRIVHIRQLEIGWFGGEPLYGLEAIEDLAPFFVQIANKHSVEYVSHMTTNGYLLTEAVATKLLSWRITHFQITLDGTAEDHDRNRPTRDGRGTFDSIRQNLLQLHERVEPFSVRVRVNFDKENHLHIQELLRELRGDLADDPRFSLGFHAVGRWGGPNDASLDICGLKDGEEIKLNLQKQAAELGLTVDGTLKTLANPGAQVCYAARPYNFIVGANGKLMKCTVALDKRNDNVIGHISTDGELVLDEDKYALWTRPAFQHDELCQKCQFLPSCQGMHCPLIRIENGESPCPPAKQDLRQELLALEETA